MVVKVFFNDQTVVLKDVKGWSTSNNVLLVADNDGNRIASFYHPVAIWEVDSEA